MPLAVGDRLGPYAITGCLGEGGMGEVYKAHDTRLDRDVAIKTSKAAFTSRFEKEARTLSKLNHPHVCQIYDVGPDYLVMEYVEGTPLKGPLPFRKAIAYAEQICLALEAAHARGVVHRDLKPENILLTRTGIKLLDFGLAEATAAAVGADGVTRTEIMTSERKISGTLRYMSPEQLQGDTVDARSDIFSFGVTLYELISGKPPFTADNTAGIIAAIMTTAPRPLAELDPAVPTAIDRVLAACLEKSPEDRWQTVRDLRRELEWIRASVERPVPAASVRPNRASWIMAGAVAGVLVAAVGTWYAIRSSVAPIPPWKITPLTSYAGLETMPAISPDGNQVAFVWNGEKQDNDDIYIKRIADEAPPLRITNTPESESSPAWSPQGDRLAFVRYQPGLGRAELIVASSLGGSERTFCAFYPAWRGIPSTIDWSPDGRSIAVAGNARTLIVDVESRNVRYLHQPPSTGSYEAMPTYAPDESAIAYSEGANAISRHVWIQPIDKSGNATGAPRQITREPDSYTGLAWVLPSKALLSSRGFPGGFLIPFLLHTDSVNTMLLPFEAMALWNPSYNAKTRRLVYQRRSLDLNILSLSLDDPTSQPRPVVASTSLDQAVDVSPDGKRIVFQSLRDGASGIWRADRDGGNQVRIARLPGGSVGVPRWSPDGRTVVFDGSGRGAPLDLYTVSSDGGLPEQLTKTPDVEEQRPMFSADGRRVYHNSGKTGRLEIWALGTESGLSTQLTHAGGDHPIPSQDGRWVYYSREGGFGEYPRLAAKKRRSPTAW